MIALYILAGIVGFVLLAGLIISKELKATREIIINRPRTDVFNYIKYLKNQDSFSKWASLDPNMKKEFRGIDGTVGAVSAWEGNKKVGQGEQEITAIVEGKSLHSDLRFIKPFKSLAKGVMTTEDAGPNQTKVTWAFESQLAYPMNVMKLFMNFNKSIGNDFSTGLSKLKTILEK